MVLLSQHIDTFKEALYLEGDTKEYNDFVEDLLIAKKEAQEIKSENDDHRFTLHELNGLKLHIMARSIKGYSVVAKTADISIAFKRHKGEHDKNPSIKIEYRASFLANYGIKEAVKTVREYITKIIPNHFISKTQEIHLANDVQGHHFTFLDVARFKTRARKTKVYESDDAEIGQAFVFSSKRIESLYFGSSNNMLRIYNKTTEMKKNLDSQHIIKHWLLNPNYNDIKDVWRIEFQLRRVVLKSIIVDDIPLEYTDHLLENLATLWDFTINYFSYRSIDRDNSLAILEGVRILKNKKEKLLTKNGVRYIMRKSELHPLWELLDTFTILEKPHYFRFSNQKSAKLEYVSNSICSLISTSFKAYGKFDGEILDKALQYAQDRAKRNHDKDLIELQATRSLDYFAKIDYQARIGQEIVDYDDYITKNLQAILEDGTKNIQRGDYASLY